MLARRREHGSTYLGSVPHSWMRPLKQDGEDRMKAATERVKRELGVAVAEERQRWSRAAKCRRKDIGERPAEGVRVGQDIFAAMVEQKTSTVMIWNSAAPPLERRVAARPADVWSVQVTADAETLSSTGGRGACEEEENDVADAESASATSFSSSPQAPLPHVELRVFSGSDPGLNGRGPATVADAVAVEALEQNGGDVLT